MIISQSEENDLSLTTTVANLNSLASGCLSSKIASSCATVLRQDPVCSLHSLDSMPYSLPACLSCYSSTRSSEQVRQQLTNKNSTFINPSEASSSASTTILLSSSSCMAASVSTSSWAPINCSSHVTKQQMQIHCGASVELPLLGGKGMIAYSGDNSLFKGRPVQALNYKTKVVVDVVLVRHADLFDKDWENKKMLVKEAGSNYALAVGIRSPVHLVQFSYLTMLIECQNTLRFL
ncbi:unnamed protein product [Protopolystoma xenopodis]|uniref:Uncharacterized protein n=1 Tax=Protopolystoma xenopodis TaxID=117903 RepID=A0A448XI50_9PLAT|nr:unnamed protein product [Protopolystoma xenopodis]